MDVQRDRRDRDHGTFDVQEESGDTCCHAVIVDLEVWRAALQEYGSIPAPVSHGCV
jgi:hypothetical protein